MRTWMRRLAWLTLALVVIGAIGAYSVYHATQYVPTFYEEKLVTAPAELEKAGNQLEQQVMDLHNDLQDVEDDEDWNLVFSDDHVNGWLAVNLKKKFPRLLPYGIRDPRVEFSEGQARIACQYTSPKMTAVLSLEVDAFATDEPNIVAVRLQNARIGAVPGILKMATDEISSAARRAKIELRWVQLEGDPVALVTIPDRLFDDDHQFQLDGLQLADGELRMAGKIVHPEESPPAPTEPLDPGTTGSSTLTSPASVSQNNNSAAPVTAAPAATPPPTPAASDGPQSTTGQR